MKRKSLSPWEKIGFFSFLIHKTLLEFHRKTVLQNLPNHWSECWLEKNKQTPPYCLSGVTQVSYRPNMPSWFERCHFFSLNLHCRTVAWSHHHVHLHAVWTGCMWCNGVCTQRNSMFPLSIPFPLQLTYFFYYRLQRSTGNETLPSCKSIF